MPGVYVHIPFCAKACYYCDFHFKAHLEKKERMICALSEEIRIRTADLPEDAQERRAVSLYFGGGTPSVLSPAEWETLWRILKDTYHILPDAEITAEVNPEDLSLPYLVFLKKTGINRLSIGIQSFDDQVLQWMNRRHTASRAITAVQEAREAGFDRISVDLMYGIPGMSAAQWEKQLDQALALTPEHLSAYHLTIEPRTVFGVRCRKGQLTPVDERDSLIQYRILTDKLAQAGYRHYEISNFARPGYEARHNSSYWRQEPYIGFGPSAHSFDGTFRRWNIAHNDKYMQGVFSRDASWYEMEKLTEQDQYNEYLMTSLRTADGVRKNEITSRFGKKYTALFERCIASYLSSGQVLLSGPDTYRIAERHWMLSDSIIRDLFLV